MPLNIPNVGSSGEALLSGLRTGGNLFSQIMNPILRREQLSQQKQLQQAHDAQLLRQHLENLGLRRQAEERASQLFPLQLQAMQDAHAKSSPDFKAQQFKSMVNALGGGEVNLEAMKKNPMLRGFFKTQMGFDPLEPAPQTPEQKRASALDLFNEKENIKAQRKGGDNPTNTVLTQNQQALQSIDTVIPKLDEFIDNPDKIFGRWQIDRGLKAAYESKAGSMVDTLLAAQNLPKTNESVNLVKSQVMRAIGESTEDYISRLKDLKKDLIDRRNKSRNLLESRKVNTKINNEDFSKMSDEELQRIAGGG